MTCLAAGKGKKLTITLRGNFSAQALAHFSEFYSNIQIYNYTTITFDMKDVYTISFKGLGILIEALANIKQNGCKAEVIHLRPELKKIIDLTDVDMVCTRIKGKEPIS